jgi:hypothetical protein
VVLACAVVIRDEIGHGSIVPKSVWRLAPNVRNATEREVDPPHKTREPQ